MHQQIVLSRKHWSHCNCICRIIYKAHLLLLYLIVTAQGSLHCFHCRPTYPSGCTSRLRRTTRHQHSLLVPHSRGVTRRHGRIRRSHSPLSKLAVIAELATTLSSEWPLAGTPTRCTCCIATLAAIAALCAERTPCSQQSPRSPCLPNKQHCLRIRRTSCTHRTRCSYRRLR